jgi:SAM-dependent methyltransferase
MPDSAGDLDARRLAFGRVAELYDRVRPDYPRVLRDAVLDALPSPATGRVLEIGAGTGKATRWLTSRGHRVVALEPDPEMARVVVSRLPASVEWRQNDFERWPSDERFAAVVSVQAWHCTARRA